MFKQEWYGAQAKVIEQKENYNIVDYGCEGKGTVTNYNLFAGVQISFLEFNTTEVFESQKFNSDIIAISHCRFGRYECEFANHTMAYLPEGYFSVNGTKYLPISFSFSLQKYSGVSLVIDKQALDPGMHWMMGMVPIHLEKIGTTLDLEKGWYVSNTPSKLQQLFSELYAANGIEQIGYFKIKAIELLYHMDQLTLNNGCDFEYFDKGQIQATKRIHDYLVSHLDERPSLNKLTKEEHINLSLFHSIFAQIYGDTPYAYLKKYKMNLAAQYLLEGKRKIGEIAAELGYSNASKFAKAFQSVYDELPKDYRKKQK